METVKLTVFTPTFNRGRTLGQLYKSLCEQECKEFVWLIVDDGSTDDTESLVQKYINEKKIRISFHRQTNSGKHVAHNLGVQLCDTELFFCVDSDDFLTPDAVAQILDTWSKVADEEKDKLSGIVAYRRTKQGGLIGNEFPDGLNKSPLRELYKLGKKGDTALIFRTEVLREFPFPVFKGEKFLRENLAYDLIDEKYSLLVMRKGIYVGEYLEDGLSKNATRLEMKSPKGAALYRYKEYLKNPKGRYGIRQLAAYIYFSIKAKEFDEAKREIGLMKCLLVSPFVIVGAIRYKIMLRE